MFVKLMALPTQFFRNTVSAFAFSIALCMLSACEGYRCANGTVKDKITDKPLDSVLCIVTSGSLQSYTDSTGKFDLCNKMGGCVFGCKDITVEFSKNGYKTQRVTNPERNSIIYLEK